jgi:hypothetical protein
MPRKKGSKTEVIEPNPGDKRYIRRDRTGQFNERQVDVGRSFSRDKKSTATRTVPKGQGISATNARPHNAVSSLLMSCPSALHLDRSHGARRGVS